MLFVKILVYAMVILAAIRLPRDVTLRFRMVLLAVPLDGVMLEGWMQSKKLQAGCGNSLGFCSPKQSILFRRSRLN
jgi:hypothetical protein